MNRPDAELVPPWAPSPSRAERRRQARLARAPFVESSEQVPGINNRSWLVRSVRLLIRYVTRLVGYRAAAAVLRIASGAISAGSASRPVRYVRYLLLTNRLRIEYIERLSRNKLDDAVRKKIRWAELVLAESMSRAARWDAKAYLSLLARHGHYTTDYGFHPINKAGTGRKFYIYGPNARVPPSEAYNRFTIVLTKPNVFDVAGYDDAILFINSSYHSELNLDSRLRSAVTTKYHRVYVSCRTSRIEAPFARSRFPISGNIAGAQGLGRVLYNLIQTYGRFECVVEGFDLYVNAAAYGAYYPHLARQKDATISERVVCKALEDHDALYNFLFVKEIVGMVELVDSNDFREIISLSGDQYLRRLAQARDFTSLRSPR